MINTEVQINLSSQVATPIIQAVQGDTGRSVTFVLSDLVIPSGAEATYYVAKPSGECVYNVATISGNNIICDLTAQSLAEVGENNMQIRVLADGKVVTSFEALLMVRAFIGDGAVESSTESTVFDRYFENAKEEFHEAAQEVADKVIETIPADYTALSNQVSQINERLSALKDGLSEDVSVPVTESDLIVGRANADGTFSPGNTGGRYVFRHCVGVKKITYVSRYWGTPGAVFYDYKLNVIGTYPNSTATTPTVVTLPDNCAYYAINATSDMLSSLYVTEHYYDVAESLDNKVDDVIENVVDVASVMVNHPVNNNGEIVTGQTNAYHIWRNCENVDVLKVHSAYWSTPRVIFFDSDGAVLSIVNWQSGDNGYLVQVPTGAVEYAVNNNTTMVNVFAITEYVNTKKQIMRNDGQINALKPDYADLVLPSFIPLVVDLPSYLYWEPIITNGYLKQYMLSDGGSVFGAYLDVRAFVPTTAGNTSVTVQMFDNYKVIKSKSYTQKIVAKNTSGNAKCLIIGDSKSVSSLPWETLNGYLSADSNLTVTFLGTATRGPIRNEAYSGRSIVNVCDDEYIEGTTPNIFYDASVTTTNGHHFSFAKGVSVLGATPDIVFIDHGSNLYGTAWDTVKGCYDDVIASIHAVSASIKIVIVIQEGQGLTRGMSNSPGKWWLENPSFTNAKKLLAEYRDRDSEKIYIQPTYVCVDLYNDFPLCSLPTVEGARGERLVCMDSTHPGLNTAQWNSGTAYTYGAWVAKNGKGYGCKKANTNIDPETDDGTYWSECKNLGDGYRKKGLMYYCMLKYLMTV